MGRGIFEVAFVSVLTPYVPAPSVEKEDVRARTIFGVPRMGLVVALASLWLGIMWVGAVPPMNAPDEPAYLQAVMETRNKRMLPEIHFDFSKNASGHLVGDP